MECYSQHSSERVKSNSRRRRRSGKPISVAERDRIPYPMEGYPDE
jgi:hypothetical protein